MSAEIESKDGGAVCCTSVSSSVNRMYVKYRRHVLRWQGLQHGSLSAAPFSATHCHLRPAEPSAAPKLQLPTLTSLVVQEVDPCTCCAHCSFTVSWVQCCSRSAAVDSHEVVQVVEAVRPRMGFSQLALGLHALLAVRAE